MDRKNAQMWPRKLQRENCFLNYPVLSTHFYAEIKYIFCSILLDVLFFAFTRPLLFYDNSCADPLKRRHEKEHGSHALLIQKQTPLRKPGTNWLGNLLAFS